MQHYYKPKVLVLKGEDEIKALEEYIMELKCNKPEELSQKQAQVMRKLAKGLVSAIEEESIYQKSLARPHFLPKLETTIKNYISKIFEESEEPTNKRHTYFLNIVHRYPSPVKHEM